MDAEVVVVGAGIVGASIALQLARRDVGDVLLVDAGGPAGGMSGRSFRQVRTHYSNEVTTRLARRGIEILRGWGDHVGVGDPGFEPVGYLLAADGLACGAWEPDSGLIDPVKVALSATVAAQMSGARTLFGRCAPAGT